MYAQMDRRNFKASKVNNNYKVKALQKKLMNRFSVTYWFLQQNKLILSVIIITSGYNF